MMMLGIEIDTATSKSYHVARRRMIYLVTSGHFLTSGRRSKENERIMYPFAPSEEAYAAARVNAPCAPPAWTCL